MLNSLNGLITLANKLVDAIAIFNAKREQAKTEQRRKQVQDEPIDEFEKMFGPAANADDVNKLRKSDSSETLRSNSTTVGLDKDK